MSPMRSAMECGKQHLLWKTLLTFTTSSCYAQKKSGMDKIVYCKHFTVPKIILSSLKGHKVLNGPVGHHGVIAQVVTHSSQEIEQEMSTTQKLSTSTANHLIIIGEQTTVKHYSKQLTFPFTFAESQTFQICWNRLPNLAMSEKSKEPSSVFHHQRMSETL